MYNIKMNKPYLKSKLSILFVLLCALSFAASTVYAEQINLDNIPEIEPIVFMPEDEFEEKTKPIDYKPEDNKNLAHEVRLPAEWTKLETYKYTSQEQSGLGENVLGNVLHFVAPSNSIDIRSFFTVDAMKLTYEIGAQNWFVNYALTNGLSLERMTIKNKRELEAIYVEVRKDTTYIVRVRAIINGSEMVVVRYYVAQQEFKKEKVMQAQVVKSFKLQTSDNSPIENLKTFGFLSQSYFDYPPSWGLTSPKIQTINSMKAKLHRSVVKDKLDGQIDIELTNKLSAKSRADIISKFRKNFLITNYEVGGFIEEPDMEYHSDMSFGTTQSYELKPTVGNMKHYELWVSVLEGKDYYYLINLITPARKDEFYAWARNVETYKLVVKNMRRHDNKKGLFDFVDH